MSNKIKYIKPENKLQKKSGVGGLSPDIISRAQMTADNIQFDYMPFASKKIILIKNQLESEEFITAQNDNTIDNFLFNLVPLDVNMKLCDNEPLSIITTHLLRFVEKLPMINIDAYNVMRVHVNALDVTFKKKIEDPQDHVFQVLVKELEKACNRYDEKYAEHNSTYEDLMDT